MSIPQASLLSQITGITFAGEDDPRLQTHAKDLCDDFRLDALRFEAAAEARISEEVDRIRQQFCAPMESIDYHYRLLTDRSLWSSPAYFVGGQPSQTLELKFHQPATVPVAADMDADELKRSRSLQEEFACCICLNLMYEPTSLTCGHSGCLACMKRAVRTKPQCPVCKARVHHELAVTIALRTAIKRLCPEYGPAVDTMSASTVAASLAGGVDLRGSLEVVCRHLGLRYEKESNGTVKFILSDTAVKRSFSHANLPLRRLLEDSRMVHPVYAEGVVEQRKQLFMRMVADEDTPCHSITNIPAAIVDTLVRPLLVKAGPHRDWIHAEHERFQSALATVTGVAWEPFQSTVTFDQWLPRRLLQKLCRRAGCPMESGLALMELRTELRKFLEALLTVAHELPNESLITCDTLLRSLPRLYSVNRAELRVFGYGVVGNIRHLLGAQLAKVLLQVHSKLMLDEVAMSVVHDLVVTTMLDVAGFAKAHSMQCGRLSATLKCGDAAAGEAGQRRSWEYSVYEVSADGTEGAGDVVPVVMMDDVLLAIRTIVCGDLARHAISECAKATKKYRERNATGNVPPPGMEMRHWTGLALAPESIALIVDTYFGVGEVRLTVEGLICLVTLTEYLSAELLELSGNAVNDLGFNVISPYHLSLAILHDGELLRLYPGMIRYGGQVPTLTVGFNAGNIRHLLGAQLAKVLPQVHPTLMLDEVAMSVVHDLVVTTMLDVAGFAKAHSMQCGRLSAALKCGDAAAGEAGQRRSWEYSVYEVSEEGTEGAGDVVPVVTMDDVQMAIRTIVCGDLASHAISECAKATKKYRERNTTNYAAVPPGMEMRHWTGLQLAAESIALIVDTYFGVGDVRLTVEALICLAALTEYLTAELLELSGNAAKDSGRNVISPHHLSLAILHDGELLRLYPGMIRYGCHLSPLTAGFRAVNATPNTTLMQTVDAYMASLVSTGAVVPHLLCGRFVGPNDSDVPGTESPFMLLPVFDCLAYPKLGEAKRQVMAIEAAPLEVQQAVECMGADVASTWRRRMLELKREQLQRPMLPLFTHETVFALSSHVMQGLGGPAVFTMEAIDLLATVTESFMIRVVRDAHLVALQAKRYVLEPTDIPLRGERA